jgi:hypothetical protein
VAFVLIAVIRDAMRWVATTERSTGDRVRDPLVEAIESRFRSTEEWHTAIPHQTGQRHVLHSDVGR